MLRWLAFLFVLLAVPAGGALAQTLPKVAAAADSYLEQVEDRFGETADAEESRTARLAAEAALKKGDWGSVVRNLERSIGLGADRFDVWLELAAALPHANRKEDAVSAAYLAYVAAAQAADRGKALFRVGALLEELDRPREARAAYEAGLSFGWDQAISERVQALESAAGFRVASAAAQTDSDEPRLCVEFRAPLRSAKAIHYEDYVKVSPAIAPVFSVSDETLCIGGASWGTSYEVTVLKGLPSSENESLASDEKLTIAVGDRKPSVGFRTSSYVLPNVADAGVPLVSVNLDRARLRLLRINDRALVDQLFEGRFLRALDGYTQARIAEAYGEEIWKGEVETANERNRRMTTSVPIREVLPQTAPGVYILTAEAAGAETEDWAERATQWLIVTDIGLTTISGHDGLHVFVRSLASGRPLPEIDVRLFARNNEEIGRASSDAAGMASFAPGLLRGGAGRTATAIMAFAKGGDFSFLDLSRPAFDLSDRGVGGRLAPGPTDLFLYTDRGVYRPGETVQLSALLRNEAGNALSGLPLAVKVLRPDGVEVERKTLASPDLGYYGLALPISATARTGSWSVLGYLDPEGDPIGQTSFLVEEVVPARIEVSLESDARSLGPEGTATVSANARYLYGAPAADLQVKSELIVKRDEDPYPTQAGFRFGLADEAVDPVRTPLDETVTDAAGKAELAVATPELPDTAQPLQAVLRVEVYELGGRPVVRTLMLPILSRSIALGIKPLFADDEAPEGGEAAFEVIAVQPDGARAAAPNLHYELIREDWDYQWFYRDGSWDYQIVVRDEPLTAGDLSIGVDQPGRIAQSVGWGRYRVEVSDPASGAASSVRFGSGWSAAPGIGDTPDRLQVVADRSLYQPGETAKVLLKPPFAGQVLLAVATDRLLATKIVDATPDGTTVEIPVDAAWGAGAYVLATAFRPGDAGGRGPGRAIGVSWLGLDPAPRRLAVSFDLPPSVEPRQSIEVPVAVAGVAPGKDAYLTLAAVDEGILQLTDFQTPAPDQFFFGKRQLGVAIRDLYGQLIDPKEGRRGKIREGGDESALARRGAPPTVTLVALFSGLVKLDASGHTRIKLDLPDYNGRLRLMAVAFDATKVGAAEAGLIVRDPIVAQASMPRFLAPGDASELTLSIQNLSGPAGRYGIVLSADGGLAIGDEGKLGRDLAVGASTSARVSLRATAIGEGRITLALSGPDGYRIDRTWRIGVRPAQLPVVDRVATSLKPGESLTLGSDALARFLPGTGELIVSLDPFPNLDVPGLLRTLDRYPYGCLEQTTSRALPLLYVDTLSRIWGVEGQGPGLAPRVQGAVGRVLEMQRFDGSFALWRPEGGAEPWLSAYAMDFLTRARLQGFSVPDLAYRQGLKWLTEYGRDYRLEDSEALGARAYAQYVLAAAQAGDVSTLRYLHDNYARRMPTALAAAQLGAALALSGDQQRAESAFRIALAKIDRQRRELRDYGSPLRDLAATVALMAESKFGGLDLGPLADRLAAAEAASRYLSTQEQTWLVMAARILADEGRSMSLALDGVAQEPRSKPLVLRPAAADLASGLVVRNAGEGTVWGVQTLIGVPEKEQPPMANGFRLTRSFYDLDGKEVALGQVRQSDVLVVVLKGRSLDDLDHQALVIDLLPAGFEIENARLAGTRTAEELSWLPALTEARYVEFLDDRFVAAADLGPEMRDFTVAYLVRAVTPGTYRLPGAEIEDMYQPQYRARLPMGRVTVAAGR